MAKRKPPRIEVESVPKVPSDELDRFLERVYFRIRNNLAEMEKGKLNAQWVAFESLGSLLPLMEVGADHEMLKGVYPVKNWRDDTVEVPTEILKALVVGWNEYADSGKTLGQAFGFEPLNRQGSSSMKKTSQKIDRDRKISARTLGIHTQIGDETPNSREDAIAKVAEEFDVSESTVDRAYREFGQQTFETISQIENLDQTSVKTSRSADLDE